MLFVIFCHYLYFWYNQFTYIYITSEIAYITCRYKAHVKYLNTLHAIIHFCFSSFLMQTERMFLRPRNLVLSPVRRSNDWVTRGQMAERIPRCVARFCTDDIRASAKWTSKMWYFFQTHCQKLQIGIYWIILRIQFVLLSIVTNIKRSN